MTFKATSLRELLHYQHLLVKEGYPRTMALIIFIYLYLYPIPSPTVQSLKLADECDPCTIRNSSVAIKR